MRSAFFLIFMVFLIILKCCVIISIVKSFILSFYYHIVLKFRNIYIVMNLNFISVQINFGFNQEEILGKKKHAKLLLYFIINPYCIFE